MYKSLKMTWAPKVFPTSKPFYLEGRDSLLLPWNRNLNIFNDSVFMEESGFANLKSTDSHRQVNPFVAENSKKSPENESRGQSSF